MKKDKIYWIYRRRQLIEAFELLLEDRQLAKHNADLIIANQMLIDGHHQKDAIDQLELHHPQHTTAMLHHWYLSGGDVPVLNYIRAAAIKAFNIDTTKVKEPKFEGKTSIHPELLHIGMIQMMRNFNRASANQTKLHPEPMTIYRGVGIDTNMHANQYVPHALESWTTDIDTARRFSKSSHNPNSIPHVFKATINHDGIFTSHLSNRALEFIIPKEHHLIGKEEVIPFGDKLQNIERIE